MPYLIQTRWNGQLHHSIEHEVRKRPRECLGTETARLLISDREVAQGIDALIRENFPEIFPLEAAYHGA